jgi:hypothetical protein
LAAIKKPLLSCESSGFLFGGLGRNRTIDTRIFNPCSMPALHPLCPTNQALTELEAALVQQYPAMALTLG